MLFIFPELLRIKKKKERRKWHNSICYGYFSYLCFKKFNSTWKFSIYLSNLNESRSTGAHRSLFFEKVHWLLNALFTIPELLCQFSAIYSVTSPPYISYLALRKTIIVIANDIRTPFSFFLSVFFIESESFSHYYVCHPSESGLFSLQTCLRLGWNLTCFDQDKIKQL